LAAGRCPVNRFKIVLWLLVLGFAALVVYQNLDFFSAARSLRIDLGVTVYHTPEIALGLYFLAVFLIGLLAAYFASLGQRFRSRQTVRALREEMEAMKAQTPLSPGKESPDEPIQTAVSHGANGNVG